MEYGNPGLSISIAGLIVSFVIALFIYSQVRAAIKANQKDVMPILGLTWEVPELSEKPDPLYVNYRRILELTYANLVIYVHNAMARNLTWKISMNDNVFWLESSGRDAIPHLKEHEKLSVEKKSILREIKSLGNGEVLFFEATFEYESIFNEKYRSKYFLTLKRAGEEIYKEENHKFEKCPWDSSFF
jgi:hypothetical protein